MFLCGQWPKFRLVVLCLKAQVELGVVKIPYSCQRVTTNTTHPMERINSLRISVELLFSAASATCGKSSMPPEAETSCGPLAAACVASTALCNFSRSE